MYKSNLSHKKGELSEKFFSPQNIQPKPKQYMNSDMPKFKPVNLYSSYFLPFQNGRNFSVKNEESKEGQLSQNLLNDFNQMSKNINPKMLLSPNTTDSDLQTKASLTTNQSSESLLSNPNNQSLYVATTPFQPMIYNNYPVYQFPVQRYGYQMNFMNKNNGFINGNCLNMNMKFNMQNDLMTEKKDKFKKNWNNKLKNVPPDNKIDKTNYNSNNSKKSDKSNSNSGTMKSKDSSITNNSNSVNNSEKDGRKIGSTCSGGGKKKYFNKFNSPKENTMNENTVILTLKIKVAPNDYRTFNLKKYDDLFISLEKFFDLNKIKQDLVKPIVTKIFAALNKIFWLLNNKIGIYDQTYLSSLHKLWIKNNEKIPKRDDSKEEDISRNKKSKNPSDKSTISSSDSSEGIKKHKNFMSNSFQNVDSNSEDEKGDTVKSF